MGGYTDPESLSYDPTLPRQPGICFSATTPGMTPVPQVLYSLLAELAMGCTNPLLSIGEGGVQKKKEKKELFYETRRFRQKQIVIPHICP